ncbi:MAG: hypothetical protein GBAus27B_000023 [Mycoplasmataceae bacterium]|nr:MAG: hypothetical protein GBAus27B_000023 [Mycoplasmataceae bacterium]
MSEISTFLLKAVIIVLAIPITFLLIYLTGLLISKIASKYCPKCSKKETNKNKSEKELLDEEL